MKNYLCIVLTLATFCACTKDKQDSGKSAEQIIQIDNNEEELTVSFVDFYKNVTPLVSKGGRTGNENIVTPTTPSGAIELSTRDAWKHEINKNYKVSSTFEIGGFNIGNNNNYYVESGATFTCTDFYGGSGDKSYFHILSGATLDISNIKTPSNIEINIYEGANVILHGQLVVTKNTELNIYTEKVDFGTIEIAGGEFYIYGKFQAENLLLNSGEAKFNTCAVVNGDIRIDNSSAVKVNSYLWFENMTLTGKAELEIEAGALVKGTNLNITNKSVRIEGKDDEENYSLILVENLSIDQKDMFGVFQECLAIDYDRLTNNSGGEVQWPDKFRNNKNNTSIKADGCRPAHEATNPDVVNPAYYFENIAKISAPKDMSATSISNNGNVFYISWHLNAEPNDYKGYIDLVTLPIENNGNYSEGAILSSRITSELVDFNHIMYHENNLYTVGGSRKGALFSIIPTTGSSVSSNEQKVVQIKGSSANCIAHVGSGGSERMITASGGTNAGIEVFRDFSFADAGSHMPLPYAKYVGTSTNRIAILNGGTSAMVKLYESSDIDLKEDTPITVSLGDITPIDGKNVVVIDDVKQRVYIAAGDQGLLSYDFAGENKLQYVADIVDVTKGGFANGVAFDENYIYVAYASKGVHVLDRNTFEYVHHYLFDAISDPTIERASANFVAVNNDYVYVAYGKDGVHVMKFAEK